MKKNILIFFAIFFVLGIVTFSFAQARELEIDYPEVTGVSAPETVEGTDLPDYVKYIFNFAIGIAALLALGVIITGGVRRVISAGNPTVIADANGQIGSGLFGLGILLGSYLLLTTINPQLVEFKDIDIESLSGGGDSGVWICTEKMDDFYTLLKSNDPEDQAILGEYCYNASIVSNAPEKFQKENNYFYLVDSNLNTDSENQTETSKYGAILYNKTGEKGNCQIISADDETEGKITLDFASIAPFILVSDPEGNGIKLYTNPDLNTTYIDSTLTGEIWPKTGYYTNGTYTPEIKPLRSIEVSGQYIAVLSHASDGSGLCQAFDKTDNELANRYIGTFCSTNVWTWFTGDRIPCARFVKVISGEILGSLQNN
jgi:hypothetical protein